MLSARDQFELQQLRREHAAVSREVELTRRDLERRYDPDQPRVPAGQTGGGRWTGGDRGAEEGQRRSGSEAGREGFADRAPRMPRADAGWAILKQNIRSDGSVERQTVVAANGDAIASVFAQPGEQRFDEQHTVRLADGTIRTFETSDKIQKIYDGAGDLLSASRWTESGPEPVETVQQAFLVPLAPFAAQQTITAAMTLYAFMAMQSDKQAVIAFRAREYAVTSDSPLEVEFVGTISEQEARDACPRLKDAQILLDKIVNEVRRKSPGLTPQAFGNEVHTRMKSEINGQNDPRFKGEFSFLKSKAADDEHGTTGSIRGDSFEDVSPSTACVHDWKTGDKKMSAPRSGELAYRMARDFPGKTRLIVTVATSHR